MRSLAVERRWLELQKLQSEHLQFDVSMMTKKGTEKLLWNWRALQGDLSHTVRAKMSPWSLVTRLTVVPPINIGEGLGKSLGRRVYINKSMSAECGCTVTCPGCRAAEAGIRARSHTEECRTRIEQRLGESEKGRDALQKALMSQQTGNEERENRSDREYFNCCTARGTVGEKRTVPHRKLAFRTRQTRKKNHRTWMCKRIARSKNFRVLDFRRADTSRNRKKYVSKERPDAILGTDHTFS